MIKRLIILTTLFLTLAIPTSAFAFSPLQQACSSGSNSASVCQNDSGNNNVYGPDGVLDKIINILCVVIGFVAVFVIILAGFQYVLSGGDSARINTAKNTILFAIVGIVIVALAQIIEYFVINHLGHALN